MSAGLPLTPGQGTQTVETPRDRADEPPFPPAIGGDRSENRGARLVGAVGTAQSLDGVGSPPARFKQEMDAAAIRRFRVAIGMVAATGAAGVGEDENPLGARHEAFGLDQIAAATPAFDALVPGCIVDQPPGAPGHLGYPVRPEMTNEFVQRQADGRERA